MLTLLSPAKKLNMDPVETGIPVTKPRLRADTKELAIVAKSQTAKDLKRLMHISDNLATMNFERFQAFNLSNRSNSERKIHFSMPSSRSLPHPSIRRFCI